MQGERFAAAAGRESLSEETGDGRGSTTMTSVDSEEAQKDITMSLHPCKSALKTPAYKKSANSELLKLNKISFIFHICLKSTFSNGKYTSGGSVVNVLCSSCIKHCFYCHSVMNPPPGWG